MMIGFLFCIKEKRGLTVIKNKVFILNDDIMHRDSEKYFKKICGFEREDEWNLEEMKIANHLKEQYKSSLLPRVIFSSYSADCVKEDSFYLEQTEIVCEGLKRIPKENVKAVFVYAMCIPEIEDAKKWDMLEQFYLDTWMTAYLDAGRDFLRVYLEEYLLNQTGNPVFVTHAFGPGFYGMGMEAVPQLFEVIDGRKIQMELFHGGMNPPKSNIGFFLALKEEAALKEKDCVHCLSNHKNCMFCKNYIFS